jgi:hypothetical protein
VFCGVRRYEVDPARVDELMHRVDDQFCPLLEQEEGFIAYQVLDCGDGMIISLTTCRTADSADATAALSASWVREALSDIDIQRIDASTGEAKVSRAVAEMLEPAHA